MGYGLKYYKNIPQADGSEIRLEIHKYVEGDLAPVPMEIGAVIRGLHLDIQGQTDEVDSPIVKTSLTMTFVDAPDLQGDGIIATQKCGEWEEFYTASATEWKVILKEKSPYTDLYSTIWGGYITPDSFSEELTYRGSVTLIARDNIGHLQDFPFDAEGFADGTIDLYDIVTLAWAKIESPMDLDFFGDGGNSSNNVTHWLKCKDRALYQARMNLSFFADMNYYEALEKALYALGCVMRYVGRNRVYVCPLRDMPKRGYFSYDYFGRFEPMFIAGATRELVPACKMIEEVDNYDLAEDEQPLVTDADFTGDMYRTPWGAFDAPVWSIKNAGVNGWGNTDPTKAMYFRPSAYKVLETPWLPLLQFSEEEIKNTMWLLCDGDNAQAEYTRVITPADFIIKLQLGATIGLFEPPLVEEAVIDNQDVAINVQQIKYAVKAECSNDTRYLNDEGKWQGEPVDLVLNGNELRELEVSVPASAFPEETTITFIIKGIISQTPLEVKYIAVKSLAFAPSERRSYCKSRTIKTIYNEKNNVVLTRDPELAPAQDIVALPAFIKNGIFVDYIFAKYPAKEWVSDGGFTAELPVHIHKQLLCYYSKPNNLLNGTIVNAGTTALSCNWLWRDKEHILMSGSLNLLNGQMEGAVLREFTRYEDMWNDETGDPILPQEYEVFNAADGAFLSAEGNEIYVKAK